MDLNLEMLVKPFAASGGVFGLWILNQLARYMKGIHISLQNLNDKMIVVVERIDSHEKRITKLEGD